MKFYEYPLLILLTLTQCSIQSDEQASFINQLTTNTWFVPNADMNSPSATPFVFNSDGSFTYNFTDIEGVVTPLVHKIETQGHETFAYYTFEYPFDGEVLKLYMGVGIGLNTLSQKPVVYIGEFKKEPTAILPTATTELKKTWYKDTYKESNILSHKGKTLAIQ